MNSLNRGNYFDRRQNFFNALNEYSKAIKNEGNKTSGHFNSSLIYLDLGLFHIALNQIEIAIINYFEDTHDRLAEEYELYSVRALIYERIGIYDLMQKDQDKCLEIKKNLHFPSVIQTIRMLLRSVKDEQFESFVKETFEQFDKIDRISYFAYNDLIDFKKKLHFSLSMVYESMGEFEKAIKQINSAIKQKDSVLIYHYQLGKLLFKSKNEVQAENIFKTILLKDKVATPFRFSQYQDGIVAETNKEGSAGTILTQTVFNDWDVIEFKINQPVEGLNIGDLVSIKLGYHIDQNIRKGITINVKKIHTIHPSKLKGHITFHCIINSIQNINATHNQFYFVNVFYPSSFLLPFSLIDKKLTNEQRDELNLQGFIFLEIALKFEGSNLLILKMSNIASDNLFNYVPVAKKNISRKKSGYFPTSSKKECRVCQMEEWCGTDGCPMDPQ